MKQKAAERNPDEFSYGMLSSQSRRGRKLADRQNPVLSQDVVKLLKTQDAGYVTTMLQKTKRARARLEQEFVLSEGQGAEVLGALSSQAKGSHTIFVNSKEEQKRYSPGGEVRSRPDFTRRKSEIFPMNEDGNDSDEKPPVHPHAEAPKSCRAAERQRLALKHEKLLRKHHRKEQGARRSRLAALSAREKDLIKAENELDLQRAKMSNSMGGTTKFGVKWKVRERKK